MNEFTNEFIKIIGGFFLLIVVIFLIYLLIELEYVLPNTFQKGLVKINDEVSYNCVPTKRTIDIREIKKVLNKITSHQE